MREHGIKVVKKATHPREASFASLRPAESATRLKVDTHVVLQNATKSKVLQVYYGRSGQVGSGRVVYRISTNITL